MSVPGDPHRDLLARALAASDGAVADPSSRLERLCAEGLDRLPLPGSGRTLDRWRALGRVAASDLSLAKLYEGHTDALAILQELGSPAPPQGSTWGTWAAEPPDGRVTIDRTFDGRAVLRGVKRWCSGAESVTHALLTAWHADGRGPQLVRVSMRQPGIEVSGAAWRAVGMARSASVDVAFSGAVGETVGQVGDYLQRPGFWHGGAGVAACWHGGATGIAAALHEAIRGSRGGAPGQPFLFAALGKVDLALHETAALLRHTAGWIDRHPQADAMDAALRTRLSAERCATEVLTLVGRALGAAPFCRSAHFAQAAADLPVFIRQCHGERDFAALGESVAAADPPAWRL